MTPPYRSIFTILFLFIFRIGHCQWIQQALHYEIPNIATTQIVVIDYNVVWGIGRNLITSQPIQTFSRTLDGGVNWELGNIQGYNYYQIGVISAVSENNAWVTIQNIANDSSYLLKTIDGGQTWNQLSSVLYPNIHMQQIYFWNENKGLTTGFNDSLNIIRFYSTDDGGNSWYCSDSSNILNQYGGWTECIMSSFSVHDSIVKCISSKGRLFTSYDWGKHWYVSWTPWAPDFVYPMIGISFQENMQHGLLFGNNYQLYETFNGGNTWILVSTYEVSNGQRIVWIPGTTNTCIRLGADYNDGCYYSSDGGHSWVEFPELFGKQIFATGWFDYHTGWVTEVTKAPEPALTGIFKFDSTFTNIQALEMNNETVTLYPNPCKNELNLFFQGMQNQQIIYKLLNINGQELLKDQIKPNQDHFNTIIHLNKLPAGIYFIVIKSSKEIYFKKVIIN